MYEIYNTSQRVYHILLEDINSSSCDTDNICAYAARCRAEGRPARSGEGAPLPAHCLTGALIPAKTLSRRHFVHKVRSARKRMLYEHDCLDYYYA